jgi:membrane peptidoglycan carboxypeptidase
VVTVKLQETHRARQTIQVARRLGVSSPLDVNLSLALGTSDVSLLEMTSAYGAIANQGSLDAAGHDPLRDRRTGQAARGARARSAREAVAPETAYVITQMLRGVVERGTGRPRKASAARGREDRNHERLLERLVLGFTPRLSTGVWVGYDRPRSLGKTRRAHGSRSRSGSRTWARCSATVRRKISRPRPRHSMPVDEDPSASACARADGLRQRHGVGNGLQRPSGSRAPSSHAGRDAPAPGSTPPLTPPPVAAPVRRPRPPTPSAPPAATPRRRSAFAQGPDALAAGAGSAPPPATTRRRRELAEHCAQLGDRQPDLLHRVALAIVTAGRPPRRSRRRPPS